MTDGILSDYRLKSVRVTLFIPCLVDQTAPHTALATARILERLGHHPIYDPRQTCCGQALFNMGFIRQASLLAERYIAQFRDAEVVVAPSGSCVAMVKHHYGRLDLSAGMERDWVELRQRTYELCEFLCDRLGVTDVGARLEADVILHRSCHALRELHRGDPAHRLLSAVNGLNLVDVGWGDECCGFGGAFSFKYPRLAADIARRRLGSVVGERIQYITGVDDSCLTHLGRISAEMKCHIQPIHIARILAARGGQDARP